VQSDAQKMTLTQLQVQTIVRLEAKDDTSIRIGDLRVRGKIVGLPTQRV
jgi:hypothetical protein